MPAYSGKGYILHSLDSSIAKAAWEGNGVLITAQAPGNTTIVVQDKEQGATLLKIAVFSRSVETAYGWSGIEQEHWRTTVIVKAGNARYAAALQKQLFDSLRNGTAGSGFIFRSDEVAEYSGNRQLYKAGYTVNNRVLTVYHEGWKEPIRLNPVEYHVIGLIQDLTDRYRARYPGKRISEVTITRYFTEVLPPG